ncbi:ABC transporter ATP-binding protein [Megalodesulfovibrio paquesii]
MNISADASHATQAAANSSGWSIALESLRLGYGDTVVIDSLSAEIPAGRITCILGGSGCGKSTLLKHILGLARPMAGRILLDGKDATRMSRREFRQLRRRMGVLFQDGALLGSLTLAQNVALPLTEHSRLSKARIAEIVQEKLALVGLDEFKDYHPGQLSGGMRKRAGLARALVADPPVVLCDEHTSGLDPINAASMDALLKAMHTRFNATIVAVSHDLESVRMLADHVILLHEGRALYQGDVPGLESCEDPYVRTFLARRPLNL